MTKPKQSPSSSTKPAPLVVLGLYREDALDIFVRRDDGSITQAARINTPNGATTVDMTTVMADLAEVFGWRKSAVPTLSTTPPPVAAGGSQVELPRGRAGAISAPARTSRTRGPRIAKDKLIEARESIRKYVSVIDRAEPVSTGDVAIFIKRGPYKNLAESTVRRQLDELFHQGVIGRVTVSEQPLRYSWHGVSSVARPAASVGASGPATGAPTTVVPPIDVSALGSSSDGGSSTREG